MSPNDSQSQKSPQPDLAENGASSNVSDPLLQSGSFIDASTYTSGETLKRGEPPNQPAEPTPPNSRRKRTTVSVGTLLRPDWLPSNWIVEDRMRTSGATAGTVDKYYFDPASGRRFRSKIEVMFFLETGSVRNKKPSENSESDATPSETPGGQKQRKSSKKAKIAPLNFDFHEVPENIKWALTDSANENWTPFAGDTKVPESTKQEWVAAFTSLTAKSGGRITF